MNHKNQRLWAFMLLFLLALGVRTFRGWQEVIANPDVMRYVDQMHGLAADPVATMRSEVYHPLHATLGLLTHLLIAPLVTDDRRGWIWALRIVGIIAGSLLAVQIARLARWFGAPFWASCAAAIVWIVGRRSGTYGSDGLSDMLTWTLFAESLLVAMPALRGLHRPAPGSAWAWRWALAGGLSGLAYLARPEGAVAVVILTATLAVLATCRQKRDLARRFKVLPRHRLPFARAVRAAAWLAIGFLVLALPYMFTIGGITGKKSLVAEIQPLHLRFLEEAANTPQVVGASRPGGAWSDVQKVTVELQETFFWAPWLALLLAIPLKPRLWGRPRLRTLAVVWIFVWDGVMYWLIGRAGYLDGRHTLPLIIFLHVLLALALAAWTHPMARWMAWWRGDPARWAALPSWRRWRGWPRACALLVFLLAVTPGVMLLKVRPRGDKANIAAAAQWIHAHAKQDVVVCDWERLVGYYSGNPYAQLRGLHQSFAADEPSSSEIEAVRHAHGDAPLLLGKVYFPAQEPVLPTIGDYQKVAQFESATATNKDVYVLYARPQDPWQQ